MYINKEHKVGRADLDHHFQAENLARVVVAEPVVLVGKVVILEDTAVLDTLGHIMEPPMQVVAAEELVADIMVVPLDQAAAPPVDRIVLEPQGLSIPEAGAVADMPKDPVVVVEVLE